MKTSNKVYGIIILFLFILVFTIVDLNYENKEGFILVDQMVGVVVAVDLNFITKSTITMG